MLHFCYAKLFKVYHAPAAAVQPAAAKRLRNGARSCADSDHCADSNLCCNSDCGADGNICADSNSYTDGNHCANGDA